MSRPQSAAIVDVPAQIAAWLVSFGAIKDGPTVLNSHNHQIRQLRPSEWVDIQNGKARTARAAAAAPAGCLHSLGHHARERGFRALRPHVCTRRADC